MNMHEFRKNHDVYQHITIIIQHAESDMIFFHAIIFQAPDGFISLVETFISTDPKCSYIIGLFAFTFYKPIWQ